jgi:hypothetical protein
MNLLFLESNEIDPEHKSQDRLNMEKAFHKKLNPNKTHWVFSLIASSSPQEDMIPAEPIHDGRSTKEG